MLRRPASAEEREGLVNEAAMTVASHVDEALRDLAVLRLAEFRPELGRALVGEAIDALLGRVEPSAVARKPTPAEREGADRGPGEDVRRPARVSRSCPTTCIGTGPRRSRGGSSSWASSATGPTCSARRRRPWSSAAEAAGDVLGFAKPTLFTRIAEHLAAEHARRLKERMKSLNWELFDRAVGAANWAALDELTKLGRERDAACARRGPRASLQALASGASTSRSPTGSCSGRRRRTTWSRR